MRPGKIDVSGFLALEKGKEGLPKSQKAAQTRGSASVKMAANRALYMAQEDAGEPGRGNIAKVADAMLGEATHL